VAGDISWRILSCVQDVRALLSASFLWSVSWINRGLLWGPIEFCIGLHGFQVVCLENGPDCQRFLILLFLNKNFVKKKKKKSVEAKGQGQLFLAKNKKFY
jgi:hypothetical protein